VVWCVCVWLACSAVRVWQPCGGVCAVCVRSGAGSGGAVCRCVWWRGGGVCGSVGPPTDQLCKRVRVYVRGGVKRPAACAAWRIIEGASMVSRVQQKSAAAQENDPERKKRGSSGVAMRAGANSRTRRRRYAAKTEGKAARRMRACGACACERRRAANGKFARKDGVAMLLQTEPADARGGSGMP